MLDSIKIYIMFNKHTYYIYAYDVCAVSPPFPKEGQGWFVILIELKFLRRKEKMEYGMIMELSLPFAYKPSPLIL